MEKISAKVNEKGVVIDLDYSTKKIFLIYVNI